MALTYTPQPATEFLLPQFSLQTVDGRRWNSADLPQSKAKVFVFMCNHCPYVQAIEARIIRLARYCRENQIVFVGLCANDPSEEPDDSPVELLKRWREKNYGFDYLIDAEQSVARQFGAVCTPDFFVFDEHNRLAYRGRLDDSWRNEAHVTKEELKDALIALLAGKPVPPDNQRPAMGCSIKWKESKA